MTDMIYAIRRVGECFEILDQTLLPIEERYLILDDYRDMIKAIATLQIRGAPAIGIAAVAGCYLACREYIQTSGEAIDSCSDAPIAFLDFIRKAIEEIEQSRPTAVNLFNATSKVKAVLLPDPAQSLSKIDHILTELMTYEHTACEKMADNGLAFIPAKIKTFLTHCNTGSLATFGSGTALGVLKKIASQRDIHIFVDETRPLLQGARLTMWELQKASIPCTLITDNMAAHIIKTKGVQAIITGADRIAKNGDTANKIGTFNLAILAKHFGIPFYIVAPETTIDTTISTGTEIIIEERDPAEIYNLIAHSSTASAPHAINPSFDTTPAELITAIITDKEVYTYPYRLYTITRT